MIFEFRRPYETKYRPWFAWRPVWLYGPHEWDREKMTGRRPRLVWLLTILKMNCKPRPYYALKE